MASSRLRRRLDHDPDAASQYANLDQSFVEIGTALPSLASTKRDTNEFKPLWEQEVFDEQGRKRLHGAFTGGFSAGYYNTVGSKEGWTPSTFKSSRAKPSINDDKRTSSRSSVIDAAKQFMDQEDLEELASSRQLETSSSYSAPPPPSSTYDPLMGLFGHATPSTSYPTIAPAQASLASWVEPSSSRIGAELMRKMGWRPGQGCGPRVTRAQRKKQALEFGIELDINEEGEEDDVERSRYYYAPLDRPLMLLSAVSASQEKGRGLGYDRLGGREGERRRKMQEERLSEGIERKAGIGDGEDPYGESEQMRSSRVELVDVMIDDDDNDDDEGMERMGRKRDETRRGKDETFHDGVKVLSAFVLDHEPYEPPTSSQLPPNPPKDWRPNPTKIWADEQAEAMGTAAVASAQPGKEDRGHTQLSADQRGRLLGEKLPAPPPKSVFEYLSSKGKERLSTLSTIGYLPPSSVTSSGTSSNLTPLGGNRSHISRPPPPAQEPDEEFTIPSLDSSTASLALRGFQPFSSASTSPDPTRQARYTLFLQYSAHQLPPSIQGFPFGPRSLPLSSPSNSTSTLTLTRLQTMKELNKELRDYVAAAKVFKPVSGMLGNRFTSGTSASALLVPHVEPGLYTPPVKRTVEVQGLVEPVVDEKFKLTRTTTVFKPDKLVCKRFGVVDPFSVRKGEQDEEGGNVGGKWKEANLEGEFKVHLESNKAGTGMGRKVGDVLGKESMDQLMREANAGAAAAGRPIMDPTTSKDDSQHPIDPTVLVNSTGLKNAQAPLPTLETVGLGDDERQGEETLTYEKAPRDIFEAIFKESDEEDSDDDEEGNFPLEGTREVVVDVDAEAVEGQGEGKVESGASAPKMDPTMAPSGPTLAETTTLLSSETVVDYKPTFVNRSSNKSAGKDKNKDKKKQKKDKDKRKAVMLSFDMGDEDGEGDGNGGGGGGGERGKVVKKVKKDKKRGGKREEMKVEVGKKQMDMVDEVDEWEEAPSIVHPSILASTSGSSSKYRSEEEKGELVVGSLRQVSKIAFEPVKRARAADLF
ncbi:BQ2448_80 [Microbotryum intermedium]|uniref:BQ2448_80 protein n=1 Tax=Microbotryum intermedium TaxID=269621 RepID=A0A238F5F2_9BASI|nr:BQ2448_80 [Microbotryum intermedium]